MSQSAVRSETEILAYHVLKSALAKFSQTPNELNNDQRIEATKTAQKTLDMENKILGSPESQNIHIPAQSIVKSLEEIEARYENEEDYIKDLAQNGLSVESLKDAIHRELWVEAVLDRVTSQSCEVSEQEIMDFYSRNSERFVTSEHRQARHILITVNEDYAENTPKKVKARCQEILKNLKEGADFSQLASENSECPTAMNGGEIGQVTRGSLYPEIDEVLFNLEAGEIGGPVKTEIGFHIVKCEEIFESRKVSLFDAREQITQFISGKKRTKAQKDWLSQLVGRK